MGSPFLLRVSSYGMLLLLILFFESQVPFVRSDQKKPFRLGFHLGLSVANSLVLYAILGWPIGAALYHTQKASFGLSYLVGLHGTAEVLVTLIVFDLWDYWMHLANHRIGLLWRFHKAHHSDMEVDVTTASRFHLGELVISGMIKCLMIFLWGPSLWGLTVFEVLLTGASQFHHSNIDIPLKWQDHIERIIVTPRMHRCHHALHRHCFNTNFSTIFNIWDRIFRSYHRAHNTDELVPIGLFNPRGPVTMKLKNFLLTPFARL